MSPRPVGLGLVGLSTLLWSTAGFFVRLIPLDVWSLVGWRSLLSVATLLLWALATRRGRLRPAFGWREALYLPVAATGMLGYILALSATSVANVMVVYATIPFVAAAIAWALLGERLTRDAAVASAVAFAGVLVMAAGLDSGAAPGIGLAFLMTATFAATVVMARLWPRLDTILVTAAASALCAAVCFAVGPRAVPSPAELGLIFAFSLCTQSLSYILFLAGGRRCRAAEAGLVALLDVVLAPLWVWLAFAERPEPAALAGGAITFAAVAWYLVRQLRSGGGDQSLLRSEMPAG